MTKSKFTALMVGSIVAMAFFTGCDSNRSFRPVGQKGHVKQVNKDKQQKVVSEIDQIRNVFLNQGIAVGDIATNEVIISNSRLKNLFSTNSSESESYAQVITTNATLKIDGRLLEVDLKGAALNDGKVQNLTILSLKDVETGGVLSANYVLEMDVEKNKDSFPAKNEFERNIIQASFVKAVSSISGAVYCLGGCQTADVLINFQGKDGVLSSAITRFEMTKENIMVATKTTIKKMVVAKGLDKDNDMAQVVDTESEVQSAERGAEALANTPAEIDTLEQQMSESESAALLRADAADQAQIIADQKRAAIEMQKAARKDAESIADVEYAIQQDEKRNAELAAQKAADNAMLADVEATEKKVPAKKKHMYDGVSLQGMSDALSDWFSAE